MSQFYESHLSERARPLLTPDVKLIGRGVGVVNHIFWGNDVIQIPWRSYPNTSPKMDLRHGSCAETPYSVGQARSMTVSTVGPGHVL